MDQRQEDINLLKDCLKSGDAQPFIKRYGLVIKNTIYSMANKRHLHLSHQDVEDFSQNALMDIFKNEWKRLKDYDETRGMSVTSWVVLLTHHALWDFFENIKSQTITITTINDEESTDLITIEDMVNDKEQAILFLNSLTSRERLIFKMRYFHDVSVDDIARQLKLSPSSIYNILKIIQEKDELSHICSMEN